VSRWISTVAVVMFALVILAGCTESGRYGMTFINQGTHVIESGQNMTSDIAIAGGSVTF
jgi:hypothetical protein